MRSLILFTMTVSGVVSSPCSSYTTCKDCLGEGSFCGWCSPSATVFSNGTIGSRCMDQHETDWHCNHLYSTGTCQRGYTCNSTSGQCVEDEAGSGDTLKNCEASCHKQPKDLSTCNATTLQCSPCQDYCTSDTDCPGSYCKAGLCAHSTCQSQATCNASCAAVPQEIIGIWRGVQIQSGYGSGEYDLRFNNSKNASQVEFRGPKGDVSKGSVLATPGSSNLTLTFTSGPLSGQILRGLYSPWEPSSDTLTMAFAFGAPNEDAPSSIEIAMKGAGSTVLVMGSCNPHTDKVHCDFSSVFPEENPEKELILSFLSYGKEQHAEDPCAVHPTCGTCIGDASKLCGWCTSNVTYNNGSDIGARCAGFDSTGKPLGWTCSGVFHKDECTDYGCSYDDAMNPQCKECDDAQKCKETLEDCEKHCVAPPPLYKCNTTNSSSPSLARHLRFLVDPPAQKGQCVECKNGGYCAKDSDCPGSYCMIQGPGPWTCHGGQCQDNVTCASTCGQPSPTPSPPTPPTNQTMYVCDKFSGQCVNASNTTAGATTKYECDHECHAAAPTGTYRGVQISSGFTRGEYDFTFYDDSSVHSRAPDGSVFVTQFSGINLTKAEDGALQVVGNVTRSDDTSVLPVGATLNAIFLLDTAGDDGIASMLFWGQSTDGALDTLDAAMLKSEFMLIGCKKGIDGCDFSSSEV